ncbi:hypothetical protein ACVW19_002828 [Streptomyces sp. TE5632]
MCPCPGFALPAPDSDLCRLDTGHLHGPVAQNQGGRAAVEPGADLPCPGDTGGLPHGQHACAVPASPPAGRATGRGPSPVRPRRSSRCRPGAVWPVPRRAAASASQTVLPAPSPRRTGAIQRPRRTAGPPRPRESAALTRNGVPTGLTRRSPPSRPCPPRGGIGGRSRLSGIGGKVAVAGRLPPGVRAHLTLSWSACRACTECSLSTGTARSGTSMPAHVLSRSVTSRRTAPRCRTDGRARRRCAAVPRRALPAVRRQARRLVLRYSAPVPAARMWPRVASGGRVVRGRPTR